MLSVLSGKRRFAKVGSHPASSKFTCALTITELIRRELGLDPHRLVRMFFDHNHPSYLIETEHGHALLIAMNDYHRWEIVDMIDKAA